MLLETKAIIILYSIYFKTFFYIMRGVETQKLLKIPLHERICDSLSNFRSLRFLRSVDPDAELAYQDTTDKELRQFREYNNKQLSEAELLAINERVLPFARDLKEYYSKEDRDLLQVRGEDFIHSPFTPEYQRKQFLSIPLLSKILREKVYYTTLMTMPSQLNAQIRLDQRGYVQAPRKDVAALKQFNETYKGVSWDDFKLHGDEKITDWKMNRASDYLARGFFGFENNVFSSDINSIGPGPTISSPWMMATAAILGMTSFAPSDSIWTNIDNQIEFLDRAKWYIDNDPIFDVHPFKNEVLENGQTVKQYLKERAYRCLGAAIKPREEKTLQDVEKLLNVGINYQRIFEANGSSSLEETARLCKERFGQDIILIAGQITGPYQALILAEIGVNGFVTGMGKGEMCTTQDAEEASVTTSDLLTCILVNNAQTGVPNKIEGGLGGNYLVAQALGIECRSGTSSFTGTVEQASLVFMVIDGKLVKLQNGEASSDTKILSGFTDALGNPKNVQGVCSLREFSLEHPSIVHKVYKRHVRNADNLRRLHLRHGDLYFQKYPELIVPTQLLIRGGNPHTNSVVSKH